MNMLTSEWIALVMTGLGTLFLIGEILVNARGIFAILGIGFMTVYFTVALETSSLILMLIIYFSGILLIVIDGKLLNDGTLGVIGAACMLTSVAIAAPTFGSGLYAIAGVLIGGLSSLIFLKVFKRRDMWTKITLMDRLTGDAGYNTMTDEYGALLHKTGITLSDLRPVGTVRIEHKDYSAVSTGQWISKDTHVKVIQVDGTGLKVVPLTDEA
ncbi:NfeD family protein [Lentibacillus saliphilus]|uniref:NfeD family protein n=1 Tax=Lentibacillus saliphilus TaxID=2737028 RepID=UPI001C30EAA2|nr:NfeD family protein [Lentibacillus saliphilus]